ncbi:MAG: hypothetical protein JW800_03505 [Candidatus Omnitrophica bacterium]|nr:hypothetical protein [Candidatus Omnitrophota bacterium]
MCCDMCPRYDECEENDKLKEGCCKKCPEYEYCQDDNISNDSYSEDPGDEREEIE